MEEFFQSRVETLNSLSHKYPSFQTSQSIKEFKNKYSELSPGTVLNDESPSLLAGRIYSKREAGKKLVFYDLRQGEEGVQIMADQKYTSLSLEQFAQLHEAFKRGDIIGVKGFPAKTKVGQLSIIPTEILLLAPCFHPLPVSWDGLKDPEIRYRERYLDLIVSSHQISVFQARSRIIQHLRDILNSKGFLEVETPILSNAVGGAVAKPFASHSKALATNLFLRISPELFLKQLIVAGFDRVYEIGKQFRNEGIDAEHNPEFTTCEFYMAYSQFQSLISLTEEIVSKIVEKSKGQLKVETKLSSGETFVIDFTPPFKQIKICDELERIIGHKLPNLDAKDAVQQLSLIFEKHAIPLPQPVSVTRLIDKLISHWLEPMCMQPTFLINHPTAISPLAKASQDNPQYTDRFELFVLSKEICNAYAELNDPQEQRNRFLDQSKERQAGDAEIPETDETFCRALEHAMPPCIGWGMGIDRFTMLLTGSSHIRDVLLFPLLRPKHITEASPKEAQKLFSKF